MPHKPIYLDYAAATPLDKMVARAMAPFLEDQFYNPSATYLAAGEVKHALEAARGRVAHWLGARPSEIIFTAGGTEANNLAVHGVMRQYPEGNVVVSAIEHESVLAPARRYGCREAPVDKQGMIKTDELEKLIDDKTVLVSVMYANNEVGTVQPVKEVAALVAELRKARLATGNRLPLLLHTDACQAAAWLDLHAARLGVDLLTLNGGKIYGPKQSGALFVKAGTVLMPLIDGGGQERGLRSGTENVAASIGLAAALDSVQTTRNEESRRVADLQKTFLEAVATKLPQAVMNGSLKRRLPSNVHLTFPGQDNERLLLQLEEAGILAAAGSACSASDDEPSHVLRAMGLSDDEARASLRFTMGRATTRRDIDRTVGTLARLLA